jgi:hypothetical protein
VNIYLLSFLSSPPYKTFQNSTIYAANNLRRKNGPNFTTETPRALYWYAILYGHSTGLQYFTAGYAGMRA